MIEQLMQIDKNELTDFKKGLQDMFIGYVNALESFNKAEKENVVFTFTQLNKAIDAILITK